MESIYANFRELLQLIYRLRIVWQVQEWPVREFNYGRFQGDLQLTAGGMANPEVATNGIQVWPFSGGFFLLYSKRILEANNGI